MRLKPLAAAAPLALMAALVAGSNIARAEEPAKTPAVEQVMPEAVKTEPTIVTAKAETVAEPAFEGKKSGDMMVRLRGIGVMTADRATIEAIGGDTKISNEIVPEVNFSYFLTDNVAFELIAATARHEVKAKGTAAGDLDLGKVSHLPPTLFVQWHVAPDAKVSPYFGAGVNYTMFYNADAGKDINHIDYDNSFGWALQAGTDVALTKNWYLNFDAKYIDMSTDVKVNHALKAEADINPVVLGVGVGYKF